MELIVENLWKKIKKKTILSNINLKLCHGKIYGIVGRNGSGKTMLFRAMSGLIKIDQGMVCVNGKILSKDFPVLPNLGILLENAGLYPELTGFSNLRYLADINKKITDEEISKAICRVGLDPKDKRCFRKYSLGMKQRILIAQAIMERPDILFLDEPTNALDESGVEDVRKLILEEKKRGALILIASHNKDDIGLLSDEIYSMSDGVLSKIEEGTNN